MIDPCEKCMIPLTVRELEAVPLAMLSRMMGDGEEMWDDCEALQVRIANLDEVDPAVLARADQEQSSVKALAVNFLALTQQVGLDITENMAEIDKLDCGESPTSCPKLSAMRGLFSRINDDLGKFQNI